jgi:hypothetical protein
LAIFLIGVIVVLAVPAAFELVDKGFGLGSLGPRAVGCFDVTAIVA